MEKLLIKILQKFKYVKDLKSLIDSYKCELKELSEDIKHLKERLSVYRYYFAADAREFKMIENFDSFDVVLRLVTISPYREESVLIKRYYFKDDVEYALLCAQELLDKLNEEV